MAIISAFLLLDSDSLRAGLTSVSRMVTMSERTRICFFRFSVVLSLISTVFGAEPRFTRVEDQGRLWQARVTRTELSWIIRIPTTHDAPHKVKLVSALFVAPGHRIPIGREKGHSDLELSLPPQSASKGLLFLVYEEIVADNIAPATHNYEVDLGACFAESLPQEKLPTERLHRQKGGQE